MGAKDFGVYVIVFAIFTVVIGMFSFRTKEAVSKFSSSYGLNNIINRCMSIDLLMCSSMAAISSVISITYLYFFQGSYYSEFVVFMAFSFFLRFMEPSFFSICRVLKKYHYMFFVEIFVGGIGLTLIFITKFTFDSLCLESIAIILSLQSLFRFIICYFISRVIMRQNGVRLKFKYCNKLFFTKDEISTFLRLDYINTLISIPIKQGDVIILGWFTAVENVSMYKIAKNILNILLQITNSISVVIFQKFIETESRELSVLLVKFISAWIPLVVFSSVFLFFISETIIVQFYSASAIESVKLFKIMLPFLCVSISLFWVWPLVLKFNLLKDAIYQTLYIGIIFFIFGPLASYYFESLGMAIVNSIVFTFSSVAGLYIIIKNKVLYNLWKK